MAIACGRCGTQNPDGNQFCLACGTPLAVAPPQPAVPTRPESASPFTQTPGSPTWAPAAPAAAGGATAYGAPPGPPAAPPPAYQSPYYAPAAGGPQPPVHRTPWLIIVAVIVVLVVVMAGFGAVMAFAGFGKTSSHTSTFQALSSPSPATTPTPGAPSPSPSPKPGGPTVSNAGEIVPLPSGWTLVNKDGETITLEDPAADGSVTIGSGPSNPTQNAQENKDTIDKYFAQQYPDVKACKGSKVNNGPMAGVQGIYWELCFTLTSGSSSVQAGAPLWVGANSNGTVYYAAFLITTESNMDKFIAECKPVLTGILWQLK